MLHLCCRIVEKLKVVFFLFLFCQFNVDPALECLVAKILLVNLFSLFLFKCAYMDNERCVTYIINLNEFNNILLPCTKQHNKALSKLCLLSNYVGGLQRK